MNKYGSDILIISIFTFISFMDQREKMNVITILKIGPINIYVSFFSNIEPLPTVFLMSHTTLIIYFRVVPTT